MMGTREIERHLPADGFRLKQYESIIDPSQAGVKNFYRKVNFLAQILNGPFSPRLVRGLPLLVLNNTTVKTHSISHPVC